MRCRPAVSHFKEFLLSLRERIGVGGGLGGGGSTGNEHGRSVKTKLAVTECVYSRRASPDPFERPLRHLRAGSSIARSGPALNPLPAASEWMAPRFLRWGCHYQREMEGDGDRERWRDKQKSGSRIKDGSEGEQRMEGRRMD